MWLRHSPLRSAHLLRVLLWGKEVGKGRELPSELVTNRKLQGWKFGQAKTLFQSHMTLGTSSRALCRGLGVGRLLGIIRGWVKSSAFGHISQALAPAPPHLATGELSLQPGCQARTPNRGPEH